MRFKHKDKNKLVIYSYIPLIAWSFSFCFVGSVMIYYKLALHDDALGVSDIIAAIIVFLILILIPLIVKYIQLYLNQKCETEVVVTKEGILYKNVMYSANYSYFYFEPSFWNISCNSLRVYQLVYVVDKDDFIYPSKRICVGKFTKKEIEQINEIIPIIYI